MKKYGVIYILVFERATTGFTKFINFVIYKQLSYLIKNLILEKGRIK